jgi:hypothetical protein
MQFVADSQLRLNFVNGYTSITVVEDIVFENFGYLEYFKTIFKFNEVASSR